MAGYVENDMPDVTGALTIGEKRWEELGLSDNIRTQLIKIENDYESIFSWNIKQLTEPNQNLNADLIDNVRGRLEIIKVMFDKDDKFHLNRFYLQLVATYELYNNKRYKESLLEIESVVKYLDACVFDESNQQYSDAYHHIAQATNAYIALTLKDKNTDSAKLLKDVKPVNIFNGYEKAAICAVKANIFMEYPIKGNNIALEFVNQAITNSTESEWIVFWLKAKGRARRYAEPFKMPGDDEIDAANKLRSMKSNPEHLIKASEIFKEIGNNYKSNKNHKESTKFFKLSTDIIKESIELANGDINQLNYLLLRKFIECPSLFPKSILNNFIAKLTSIKNSNVDQMLGLYYLKQEKDYVKARFHLSLGMAAGNFNSALQYVKVECLLQPVNKFPYVQTLNKMYNDFKNPKRRLTILSHILIYFNYCEQNPKEMMRYLKLYMDQDIQDAVKKSHLIHSRRLNTEKYDENYLSDLMGALSIDDNHWLLKDVKQVNIFNKADKTAICAVKANIFMEYPIKGNNIALELINQAITNSTESEWIVIWLKAKGRVRGYAEHFKIPRNDEIDAANKLCSTKSNPEHLIKASEIYKEVGNNYKSINNHRESNKFYKLSTDIIKESIELANGDINHLNNILLEKCIDCPYLFPKSILNDFITKLTSIKNSKVDQILGLYYFKKMDYIKARIHLSLGMAAGNFYSALQYVKVECLLQPVNNFLYVKALNTMYNDFENPKRRLTVLSHMLIYFNYCEQNPKEMMRYLKLYINQEIQDAVKKSHLIRFPYFGVTLKQMTADT
ncbi:hypothetical protein ACI65C_007847 [Semiaphis heraclei]